jgi:hypothetical protein
LRFIATGAEGTPPGTNEVIKALDVLGAPEDVGEPKAKEALKAAGVTYTRNALRGALKHRKARRKLAGEVFPNTPTARSTARSTETSPDLPREVDGEVRRGTPGEPRHSTVSIDTARGDTPPATGSYPQTAFDDAEAF